MHVLSLYTLRRANGFTNDLNSTMPNTHPDNAARHFAFGLGWCVLYAIYIYERTLLALNHKRICPNRQIPGNVCFCGKITMNGSCLFHTSIKCFPGTRWATNKTARITYTNNNDKDKTRQSWHIHIYSACVVCRE